MLWLVLVVTVLLWALTAIGLPPLSVKISRSPADPGAYDFTEITAQIGPLRPLNPFTGAEFTGTFTSSDHRSWQVEGFCDADDGSVFRLRFMPDAPGEYSYTVSYRQGLWSKSASGKFTVRASDRRGIVRLDPRNRWHFIWEGSGEHYFLNGTTAYWLLGWKDTAVIQSVLERLHSLKINRVRVTVAGRTGPYSEPVISGDKWSPMLRAWKTALTGRTLRRLGVAGQWLNSHGVTLGQQLFAQLAESNDPDDIYHPNFDYSRFELDHWRKLEAALLFAREHDMVVSVVLDMELSKVHPLPGSADERRFLHYAAARLSAFSNITWDLGDDLNLFRDDSWARQTGSLLQRLDPYKHLATSHPTDNAHQDRTADWFGFTSFQEWSRHQHAFMLTERAAQAATGRIIPQVNEEYGYEDTYPLFSDPPPSESADALRRSAWEIVMAGGYQTTGETAHRGTNMWPDTGGGWMNGRGDDTMTMLVGYAYIVDFFTSFPWWQTQPHDELVNSGNYCLAQPGEMYVLYAPRGGAVTVALHPGKYRVDLLNAVTGERTQLPDITAGSTWTAPMLAVTSDWALLLRRLPSLR
jgi:Domain of unknown function (DUF5060)/Protein of unknown function (DUF4038)